MKTKYKVSGMTCSACSAAVERGVRKVPGVESVQVNLLTGQMVVQYDAAQTGSDQVIAAVEKSGYEAVLAVSAAAADISAGVAAACFSVAWSIRAQAASFPFPQ